MLQYLVLLGAGINLAGNFFYIKETVQGRTQPNRVTWLIWSIAPLIATFAAISAGVSWAVVPVFMAGFVPLLIFIASFVNPKAYWKLQTIDYACGALSILALILWGLSKEPLVAIFFAIASDGLAAVPTIIKSWKHPESETIIAYTTGTLNALTSFFAIKMWSVSELAFPIYLVLMTSLITLLISRGKLKKIFQTK